jgi:methyl-accepting chemotaxis protein
MRDTVRNLHESGAIHELTAAVQEAVIATRDTTKEINETARNLKERGIIKHTASAIEDTTIAAKQTAKTVKDVAQQARQSAPKTGEILKEATTLAATAIPRSKKKKSKSE